MGNTEKATHVRSSQLRARASGKAGPILLRREMIAFVPACGLALLWIGPEAMVLLGFTAILVGWMTRPLPIPPEDEDDDRDPATGLPEKEAAVEAFADILEEARERMRPSACLVLGIDSVDQLLRQLHRDEFDLLLRRMGERLGAQLRAGDQVARWDGAEFAVLLKPTPRLNLEGMIQLCGRLQDALAEPYSISAREVTLSAYVGFRLLRRSDLEAREPFDANLLLAEAEAAARDAHRFGPGAIRAFSQSAGGAKTVGHSLARDCGDSLEAGHITAFFCPQISTDTGEICGIEVKPRWLHRECGMLDESQILPAIEAAGLIERFSEVLLFETFGALREFDRRGEAVGPASLLLPIPQLDNPKLIERLAWECDRFSIAPERLSFVLPQASVARLAEDLVDHNLRALRRLGCRIELAGFGTGPISADTMRKLAPERLRIDRPFIAGIDHNAENQKLVAAIASMAENLRMTTLAEGVASIAEHAMLGQLGCSAVQGPAIAPPMPPEDFHDWAERHRAKLEATPRLDLRKG